MDDLMGSIILGKHSEKKEDKPKGEIDNEIQDIYEATLEEHKNDPPSEESIKRAKAKAQKEKDAKNLS